MQKKAVVYIHGKGGNAGEAGHYKKFFPGCEVIGFDYTSQTPWEAADEFAGFFDNIGRNCTSITLIASSIGAFFAMNALHNGQIERAYFISPVVNMEELISGLMQRAGVSEKELEERGTVETGFGETLSWKYLSWVRSHPVSWRVRTSVLYGSADSLQSLDSIKAFAETAGADLTVMDNGGHWFHTDEQMAFLDNWISMRV